MPVDHRLYAVNKNIVISLEEVYNYIAYFSGSNYGEKPDDYYMDQILITRVNSNGDKLYDINPRELF